MVAHFLTAGQHAGSAKQQCPWNWKRFKVLLRDTSTALGLQWSMNLGSPVIGTFLYSLSPCYSSSGTKGVRDAFTYCKREHIRKNITKSSMYAKPISAQKDSQEVTVLPHYSDSG